MEGVRKTYPPRRSLRRRQAAVEALRGVSLSLRAGEVVGLLGPNGAGKTTILSVASTLLVPDAGRVEVGGIDPFAPGADVAAARRRIGVVQVREWSFYWGLTGLENLEFFGALRGLDRGEVGRETAAFAERLSLGPALDRPYRTLSTGERLRLAIARGLLGAPDLLLLDEPTRSLDPAAKEDVWAILRAEAAAGRAALLATHDVREAEAAATRVHVVREGRIAWSGPPDEDLAGRLREAAPRR